MDPTFRLGINIPARDMSKYNQVPIQKRPIKLEPDRFFSPIEDNRDQVLERIKREMDQQFAIRNTTLPFRS